MQRNRAIHTANRTHALLGGLALGACLLCGCGTTPRLADRSKPGTEATEASEAIARLERQREEARRILTRAEKAESDGKPDQAIDLYLQAVRLDESLQNAWNNLGTLLMERSRYADAVNAFQRASQLVPGDPRPEYNIGVAYQLNGWGEDAYRHFGYALGRDPSHLPSIRGYVRSAEMTGKADGDLLDIIKTATLRETDAEWRDYFLRQRYRVEAVLDER